MLTYHIGQPIQREKLERIVQRLFKRPKSELHAIFDTKKEKAEKGTIGIKQVIGSDYLCTRLNVYEGPDIKDAARIIATEGGVDVVILDFSQGDWIEGWDGITLGPYLLVKPDGSEHRARRRETPDGLPHGAFLPWKDSLYLLD